ncbi:MAG: class I SAM-dependent methyltransferase [Anaerolineales bacterium]|nr:class I SAM-dependent methyltransferase [Anaerolineales bacterium]
MNLIRRVIRKVFALLSFAVRRLAASIPPAGVECNICGQRSRFFNDDPFIKKTTCWRCGLDLRHRLFIAALEHLDELSFADMVQGRRVLHFAPEDQIRERFTAVAAGYVTADILSGNVDRVLDIAHMPEMETGSFDLVIACDVLEHVPDDRAALGEIHRILRPGGYAILTVPQQDHLERTFEDPSVTTPEGRRQAYGHAYHLRIYGEDFGERVEQAGFQVRGVSAEDFPAEMVKRNVLFPPRLSPHPMATNYRKVFFARRK